ncbi:MAG: hypothetical protein PUD20_06175 [bacterium]|nr:hypothetical protein [bacterium]
MAGTNSLMATLTMAQTKKNRSIFFETGIKPFTMKNLCLILWGPIVGWIIAGVMYGKTASNGSLAIGIICTVALWGMNLFLLIKDFMPHNVLGKVIWGNIASTLLVFLGVIFFPLIKLLGGMTSAAMSMQTGNVNRAIYHSDKAHASASHSTAMFVFNVIHYDSDISYVLDGYDPDSAEAYNNELENAHASGYSTVSEAIDRGMSYDELNKY